MTTLAVTETLPVRYLRHGSACTVTSVQCRSSYVACACMLDQHSNAAMQASCLPETESGHGLPLVNSSRQVQVQRCLQLQRFATASMLHGGHSAYFGSTS